MVNVMQAAPFKDNVLQFYLAVYMKMAWMHDFKWDLVTEICSSSSYCAIS